MAKLGGSHFTLSDGWLSILQYWDDTILFLDNDLKQTKNIKLMVCVFEQLYVQKLNFT